RGSPGAFPTPQVTSWISREPQPGRSLEPPGIADPTARSHLARGRPVRPHLPRVSARAGPPVSHLSATAKGRGPLRLARASHAAGRDPPRPGGLPTRSSPVKEGRL